MKLFINYLFVGIILLWLPWNLNAQTTVQVGNATTGTDNAPVKTTNEYHYSQSIYTAADLITGGATGSGNITKIRYYINSLNFTNSTNWTVYIGNTTKNSFASNIDWISVAAMNQCFSGTVNPSATG